MDTIDCATCFGRHHRYADCAADPPLAELDLEVRLDSRERRALDCLQRAGLISGAQQGGARATLTGRSAARAVAG